MILFVFTGVLLLRYFNAMQLKQEIITLLVLVILNLLVPLVLKYFEKPHRLNQKWRERTEFEIAFNAKGTNSHDFELGAERMDF